MYTNDEDYDIMLSGATQDGWDARAQGVEFSECPYKRGTAEFHAWRSGWTEGDHSIWQGVLMEKRKASTE